MMLTMADKIDIQQREDRSAAGVEVVNRLYFPRTAATVICYVRAVCTGNQQNGELLGDHAGQRSYHHFAGKCYAERGCSRVANQIKEYIMLYKELCAKMHYVYIIDKI